MIIKYFFIPAINQKFISKISEISADYFIFDLEDSISVDDLDSAIENLMQLTFRANYLVRFPFEIAKKEQINKLLALGFKRFIVPKIQNQTQFKRVLEMFKMSKDIKFILLVENPELLINLSSFVNKFKKHLCGIGLGSHDYADQMNMQHDLENLFYARHKILNIAKSFNIEAIDIASMEINNEKELKQEFISGVRMGYDAKFFIHPNQLNIFNKTKYFSEKEITEAMQVKAILNEQYDYPAFKLNNKIYEKPHLNRIKRIIKWVEKYERS